MHVCGRESAAERSYRIKSVFFKPFGQKDLNRAALLIKFILFKERRTDKYQENIQENLIDYDDFH